MQRLNRLKNPPSLLRRLSIGRRLFAGFGITALLVAGLGSFCLWQMQGIRAQGERIEQGPMTSIAQADAIALDLARLRGEALMLQAHANDPAELVNRKINVEQLSDSLNAAFADYLSRIPAGAEQDSVKLLRDAYLPFLDSVKKGISLVESKQVDDAIAQTGMALDIQGGLMDMQVQLLRELNKQTSAEALAQAANNAHQARIVVPAMLGATLVLMLLLAWRLSVSITRPLRQALQVARTVASGNLAQPVLATGTDEAAQLLGELGHMRDQLHNVLSQIGATVGRLNSATEEMGAIMQESASGMHLQYSEIELAATAVTQMTQAVEEVAGNAASTSTESRRSSEAVNTGQQQLDDTLHDIGRLADQVQNATAQARNLAEQTQGINKVLDVIRAVADQTNLLALNAAIEAARAGEVGRGFAVVADEVRSLAHRTGVSTREIEQMMEGIHQGTGQALQALADSASQAGHTRHRAQAARDVLGDISRSVAGIDERNQVIASAAEQQAQVAREVDHNLVRIRDLSMQSAHGAEQTRQASQELGHIAIELDAMMARFAL
ncbi:MULTISPECIES: methyl-accepting chemotaxis protein [unclassified Pseudomonas]|uniref:methyl-accepting chemotaxis protein n=1 Tax=unclassified Pseudomonas TaxID=196821 RepID=UPI000BC56992|nr:MULTISPECIES: methyl-accepting chemotaxis protein [unclassified Pseudomonas]PVZ16319.1 methyl-accepting chemotaxis protein [Pseudomonas sp. URIL14HWK12:I12]PVZ25825.1 methyl-accepting chemotaxis protein [Pseudomonas sp. URIL14HWK12:I10]PVZ36651.1 methyl-accepting chemotaxis protein [Pseudomonas sp. URIL14HWK12:I11]SNZ12894.1 methyl-accepting chemotaxis protein [Pseudomonas sp. URIL14HWK12:I9]